MTVDDVGRVRGPAVPPGETILMPCSDSRRPPDKRTGRRKALSLLPRLHALPRPAANRPRRLRVLARRLPEDMLLEAELRAAADLSSEE